MIQGTDIRRVGVAGAGTMGAGIAQALAQNGFEVQLFDVSEEVLSRAEGRILRGLHRLEKPEAFSLIRKTESLEVLEACDFVIEAVSEDIRAKHDLFRKLDSIMDPRRVIATNTSSLSVERIASAAENPDRIVGMHFFNPAPVMRLVEVVRTPFVSEAAIEAARELALALGKTVVVCKDTPGFIANRIVRPFYLAGMGLLEEGAGPPAAIDRAVREKGGFRMGPMELVDLIGLDVNLTISKVIYEALGRPERLKPRRVQEELVARGNLGRKSGCGFYVYGENQPATGNPALEEILPGVGARPIADPEIFKTILENVIAEARLALEAGVAGAEDIDTAMRLGMNWPRGPLEWGRELERRGGL
ncbi:MAG: 3-hydroxybutyryl-CoA dehydrogenase [Elusimicrobia bacterium]|nr:3-hydroxybutyryl-CoA dehydrogenase [Elusimicrobiota bacterium]